MTILGNGNVGIGNSNPQAQLDVSGGAAAYATTRAELQTHSALTLTPHASDSTQLNIGALNHSNSKGIIGMQVTNYDATSQWHLALNPFGGNIGINTHDPSYQLHICKHVGFGGDSTLCVQEIGGAEFIIKAAGTGTVIGHKTAKHLWFTRDVDAGSVGADMVIADDGNVGIGQGLITPKGVLDISHISQTSVPLTLTNYNKTTGETTAIRWRHMDPDNNADYRPVEIGTLTTNASDRHTTFFIAVADADNVDQSTDKRLVVTNSGNVGIGDLLAPEVILEVNGVTTDSSAVVFGGRSDGGNGNNRRFNLMAYADGGGANYGGGLRIQTRTSTNVFADRLAIASDGKVGLGGATATFPRSIVDPSHQLHVKTAGESAAIAIQTDGFPTWVPSFLYYRGDTLEFGTRVDDSSALGTRTWSVYDHVAGAYRLSIDAAGGVHFGGAFEMGGQGLTINEGGHPGTYPADSLIMDFDIANGRHSRFFSTGDATTLGGFRWYSSKATGTGLTLAMEINSAGQLTVPGIPGSGASIPAMGYSGGVLYYYSSSIKYKKNIVDLEVDTSKIYNLRPVSFDDKASGERNFGLIAEEVYKEVPELVVLKEEEPDSIVYANLSVLLLAEVKKLRARVEQLEAKMAQQI